MGIERCSVMLVIVKTWGGEHTINWESLGVDKSVLENFKKLLAGGRVKLLPKEWLDRIRAAQQKLRSCPEPYGSKLAETASEFLIPDAALPALRDDWEKKVGEYKNLIDEFQSCYYDVQNERLLQLSALFEHVAKKRGFGTDFVSKSLADCKAAYPQYSALQDEYKAILKPSELMALFPRGDTAKAVNDLEKMGAELRHKFIELAEVDVKCLETAHRIAWREQILSLIASLKEAATKGDIKGQTIRGVRTTLSRHKLADYFSEAGLQKHMDTLLTLLPDGTTTDYEVASTATMKNKILLTIKSIEDEVKKGNPILQKEAASLEAQSEVRLKRLIRI